MSCRRPLSLGRRPAARLLDLFLQWGEADGEPALGQPMRALHLAWREIPLGVPVELGSIALGPALEEPDPVLEVDPFYGIEIRKFPARIAATTSFARKRTPSTGCRDRSRSLIQDSTRPLQPAPGEGPTRGRRRGRSVPASQSLPPIQVGQASTSWPSGLNTTSAFSMTSAEPPSMELPLVGVVSPRKVRRYVAAPRRRVTSKEAFVHRSVAAGTTGTTMKVDFGESWVDIAGTPCKVKYLVATLPFSNAYFAKAYPRVGFAPLDKVSPEEQARRYLPERRGMAAPAPNFSFALYERTGPAGTGTAG